MTPRIPRATLFKIFGGYSKAEWFECDLRPSYRHFFCADFIAQPFAPTHVGNRGLVLLSPESTDASSQDEEGRIFHAFMSARAHSAPLHYLGDYTKIPPQDIAWSLLPKACQYAWLKRLHTSGVTAARTVRVRIRLRDTLKREPSVVEVQRGLQNRVFDDKIRWKEILEAFKSGEEKMRFVGIKCERYDAHLAAIISENRTK
ncbi:hypothetical protein BJY52DRAFT_1280855 [Lactarius psammicola]|nr:hypothetical protein BJY52DRAFT_1280855 [Lactarius psammicola]